jgi:DNA-binding Lrp family transcriptional regulator
MGHTRQPNIAGSGAARRIGTILTAIALAAGALLVVASPASAVSSCNPNFVLVDNANKEFVSAELSYTGDYYGMLRARATSVGPWESFTLCNMGTYYTLQSNANHKYVSTEVGYSGQWNGMLRARADSVGPWERFQINQINAQPPFLFDMVSDQNLLYVSAELGYAPTDWEYGMLRARSSSVGNWELFTE